MTLKQIIWDENTLSIVVLDFVIQHLFEFFFLLMASQVPLDPFDHLHALLMMYKLDNFKLVNDHTVSLIILT